MKEEIGEIEIGSMIANCLSLEKKTQKFSNS